MRNRAITLIAALTTAALLAGCGYRSGFLIPEGIHTVHVRMAENRTFWHEAVKVDNLSPETASTSVRPAYTMEVELTERIRDEVVRRTPLRLADQDRADSILTATITSFEPRVLLRDAADNALSERVDVKVDFAWTDRRSGRVLAEATGISRPTDFVIPRGETLTTATRKSFEYIAMLIVEQMQEGF